MKKIIFLFSLFCLVNISYAMNFSGKWSGQGNVDIKHEALTGIFTCNLTFLEISHSGNTLDIQRDNFADCENEDESDLNFSGMPFSLRIKNGKLFHEGNEVGFINENTIQANTVINGWIVNADAKVDQNGVMSYRYFSSNPSTGEEITKTAVLSK